ncbi:MAG: GerMN domain-containing protein [Christensenellales bacterium]|jgi:hypothetical protein
MIKHQFKKISALLAAAVALSFGGCTFFIESQPQEQGLVDINPTEQDTQREARTTTLYFRYEREELLAGISININVPSNKQYDEVVLRSLINGPGLNPPEFVPVINPETQVLSVTSNSDLLFITFSPEFFHPMPDIPSNWQEDPIWVEEVQLQRRLAVWSVVNTMTSIGKYTRVQILIDDGNSIGAHRISRAAAGFSGDGRDDELLEELARSPEVLMTAANSAQLAFRAITIKDWKRLYSLIAPVGADGNERPSEEDFIKDMQSFTGIVEYYAIHGESVSPDGVSIIVNADISTQDRNGRVFERQDIPLKMIQDNGIWKIEYPSVSLLLFEV